MKPSFFKSAPQKTWDSKKNHQFILRGGCTEQKSLKRDHKIQIY